MPGSFEHKQLETVRALKREGLTMAQIVARLGGEEAPAAARPAAPALHVTIDDIAQPAYMVNHNFELVWINEAARRGVFAQVADLPPTNEARKLFRLLPAGRREWLSLLRFHIAISKSRVDPAAFSAACQGLDPVAYARLQSAYVEVAEETAEPGFGVVVEIPDAQGQGQRHTAFAAHYREGIFVVLVPERDPVDALLDFLGRRDDMIRGLLRQRLPVLTDLAVLVADLQGSVKICSELPPQEYFALINQIWTLMTPIFRRHHGTCGKHVGDGMLYYFFPQADSDYLCNALACAHDIRLAMRELSSQWALRKHWLNELFLNTGITEGQEWLGTYPSSTGVEFVVLGDTVNQAARISDLARFGSIWASKSVVGKIPAAQRGRIGYGVRRRTADGREVFVAESFAQVHSLLEQDGARNEKLRDIATLAVTEITEVRAAR